MQYTQQCCKSEEVYKIIFPYRRFSISWSWHKPKLVVVTSLSKLTRLVWCVAQQMRQHPLYMNMLWVIGFRFFVWITHHHKPLVVSTWSLQWDLLIVFLIPLTRGYFSSRFDRALSVCGISSSLTCSGYQASNLVISHWPIWVKHQLQVERVVFFFSSGCPAFVKSEETSSPCLQQRHASVWQSP